MANTHKGKCSACSLCQRESNRYTHPLTMDQKVYNFISEIEDQTLSTTACICHACYKQASRNVGNENYHPRWKPKTHVNAYCGVTNCILEVHRHTNMATLADMEKILGTKISKGGDDSVPLCQKHYMTGVRCSACSSSMPFM